MEAAGPSQPGAHTILIGYDGSAHADHAIDEAARMFPGADAIVVTAWTSVRAVAGAGRAALSEAVIEKATTELDSAAKAAAEGTARAGADRARAAGLNARPEAIRAEAGVTQAILRAADEPAVMSVVVDSRGLSGFRSALLGSVSNAVVQHSAKLVVVVHDPADDGGTLRRRPQRPWRHGNIYPEGLLPDREQRTSVGCARSRARAKTRHLSPCARLS